MDDRTLLRQYIKDRSESAFRQLVERHLSMVFSVALRIVRDPELAKDVAQSTFTKLEQKADAILPSQVIGGWLYRTARFLAMKAARGEQRRGQREQVAVALQALHAASDEPDISEHLEAAMDELAPSDRAVLVLRYFENRSLREVGAELGISEDAARKRAARALDRLRVSFERRNVVVTATLLGPAIAATTTAVPGNMAAVIALAAACSVKIVAPSAFTSVWSLIANAKLSAGVIGILLAAIALMVGFRREKNSLQQSSLAPPDSTQTPLATRRAFGNTRANPNLAAANASPSAEARALFDRGMTHEREGLFSEASVDYAKAIDLIEEGLPSEPWFNELYLARTALDWQKRRARGAVVRYQLTGKKLWAQGSFEPDVTETENANPAPNPNRDVEGSVARTALFDFPHNRFRLEFDNEEYDNRYRTNYRIRCVEVGDGVALRVNILENSTPRPGDNRAKKHPDFWIAGGDAHLIPPSIFGSFYEPLFFAAGIVPAGDAAVRPTALVPPNDLGAFSFGGHTNENGRRYIVLREGNKEYWVEPQRDSAIAKRILKTQRGAPLLVIEIDYQETPGGWLPRQWSWTEFAGGRVRFVERIEVNTINVPPPVMDQDFVLESAPGMYVHDEQYLLDAESGRVKSASTYFRLETNGYQTELSEALRPLRSQTSTTLPTTN